MKKPKFETFAPGPLRETLRATKKTPEVKTAATAEHPPKSTEKKTTSDKPEVKTWQKNTLKILLVLGFFYAGALALGDYHWFGPLYILIGKSSKAVTPFALFIALGAPVALLFSAKVLQKENWNKAFGVFVAFLVFFGLIGFITSFNPDFDWRKTVKTKTFGALCSEGKPQFIEVWESRPGFPKTFTGTGYDSKDAITIAVNGIDMYYLDTVIANGTDLSRGTIDPEKSNRSTFIMKTRDYGHEVKYRAPLGVQFTVDIKHLVKRKREV